MDIRGFLRKARNDCFYFDRIDGIWRFPRCRPLEVKQGLQVVRLSFTSTKMSLRQYGSSLVRLCGA